MQGQLLLSEHQPLPLRAAPPSSERGAHQRSHLLAAGVPSQVRPVLPRVSPTRIRQRGSDPLHALRLGNVMPSAISAHGFLLSRNSSPRKGRGHQVSEVASALTPSAPELARPTLPLIAYIASFKQPLSFGLILPKINRILTNMIRKTVSKHRQTKNSGPFKHLKSKMKNTEIARSSMDSGTRPRSVNPVLQSRARGPWADC